MQKINNKRVVLGICGGIAALKVPELIRELTANEYEVVVILTESGRKFVTETTLTALTNQRVRSELWDTDAEQAMSHIELARSADMLIVAPATANFLAKVAHGICNDLLTTVYCATKAPILVAPAMNQAMWSHAANQRNVEILQRDGVNFVGPNAGEQACGEYGLGRMVEPTEIVTQIQQLLEPRDKLLDGVSVVVTAGPTREYIDPLRFLSNSSSGKQGYCLAEAAYQAGATVTLVSGPVDLPIVLGIKRVLVETTREMEHAVEKLLPDCDIFFSVAAVTDFRPKSQFEQKMKRNQQMVNGAFTMDFVETEDIVHQVSKSAKDTYVVGFAAETENLLENARDKLVRKNLDLVVLNDVSGQEFGIAKEENEVTLVGKDFEHKIPKSNKRNIATQIIDIVVPRFRDFAKSK
ncbi:MAG: bifunctional phosphopantothenoylcysteine decarboxylase/phosphopantothenate--cysteine ligase CoaBC [Gammaproteobacteria bacterium]|nr:bifunctional phosphopantothenoylcysteine decarboxylase/phosphopantothenate--cysteine ligase CoaBC [Gammaproteobacteria bacterium]MYF53996.1 bifunctional phosphopantothenoylcysteine decarboxylase/phosphopantothenate--cysteine ligase CoaBC [Gammaproteobacteria bacterium]MYK43961.1 bifunctional phosphopantothenoylcysteine decarboxylase/phosphopantothenate--cysteine ligase CoaBC [Gammaproteobacteria bacterium]